MRFKLIAVDIDGTLLNPKRELEEETVGPKGPPDAELPVEPKPPELPAEAGDGEETSADLPEDGGLPATAGEEVTNEDTYEETDEEENTEQTEG